MPTFGALQTRRKAICRLSEATPKGRPRKSAYRSRGTLQTQRKAFCRLSEQAPALELRLHRFARRAEHSTRELTPNLSAYNRFVEATTLELRLYNMLAGQTSTFAKFKSWISHVSESDRCEINFCFFWMFLFSRTRLVRHIPSSSRDRVHGMLLQNYSSR